MGRVRGKGKKQFVAARDDNISGEDEKLPMRRRGRPQKPVKDEIDGDGKVVNLEDGGGDLEDTKSPVLSKSSKNIQNATENVRKRKRPSQVNENADSVNVQNGIMITKTNANNDLIKSVGYRPNGSRRKKHFTLGQHVDPVKRSILDWEKRYKIIGGIARGILYLHEDSQVRIIHRDLKPSNVLLDGAMNPKIADFGMARLFEHDDTQGNTSKIAGTFGYMAPEYAMHGQFSIKSDVFSFGVQVLEIISGQKNNNFLHGEILQNLSSFSWKSWHGRTPEEIVDPCLRSGSGSMSDMVRCIHIALLCVQDNAADRPTMASVVLMLNSVSITLGIPSKPAFFMPGDYGSDTSALLQDKSSSNSNVSRNKASISDLYPR